MATSNQDYLSAFEAEQLVKNLTKFQLEDVGTSKWMIQHEAMERLNIQVIQVHPRLIKTFKMKVKSISLNLYYFLKRYFL